MRTKFVNLLLGQAQIDPRIVLITGDLGFGVLDTFAETLPNQFINAGINEQSMMGLAAGLASKGFRPFVYSIANFPTFRCLEQIRNDVCYMENPVAIVSLGAGVSYGTHGYSHHAIEDLSIMRIFNQMKIYSPFSKWESEICLTNILNNKGPAYLRLGRDKLGPIEPEIFGNSYNPPFVYRKGTSGVICWTGTIGSRILSFTEEIIKRGYDPSLVSIPIFDEGAVSNLLKEFEGETFLTVEDHLLPGGFGSWISELVDTYKIDIKIKRVGLNSKVKNAIGKEDYLLDNFGLGLNDIISAFEN